MKNVSLLLQTYLFVIHSYKHFKNLPKHSNYMNTFVNMIIVFFFSCVYVSNMLVKKKVRHYMEEFILRLKILHIAFHSEE